MERTEDSTPVAARDAEPAALFVNTASRTGQERYDEALALLRELGMPLLHAQAVDQPDQLPRLLQAAVDGGARRVIVGGGDGTLSAAAAALAGRDVRMGVLPLGTGNDFARSVRVPTLLESACRVAAQGEVRRVDVGLANGRVFLNAASAGLSTAITQRLSDELKKRLGRAAFAVVAAGEALSHQPFKVTLTTEDGETTLDAHQVVVGNGRFHGGGQLLSPKAHHDDRRLSVYVITSGQRADAADEAPAGERLKDLWNLFRVATLLRRGRHLEHPAVRHLRVTRVRVETEPSLEVDVDGELAGHTPMDFEVSPGVLQVLVPRRTG